MDNSLNESNILKDFLNNFQNNQQYDPSKGNKMISPNLIGVESKRIYFNSITGEIVPEGVAEQDMFEVDEDDEIEQQENAIDQYTDVCDQDKLFMKAWNQFMRGK